MTPDQACVRLCVRKGSKFGVWYGNHVYTLEPQPTAARYAAETVLVVGELSGDVIRITAIRFLGKQLAEIEIHRRKECELLRP